MLNELNYAFFKKNKGVQLHKLLIDEVGPLQSKHIYENHIFFIIIVVTMKILFYKLLDMFKI